MLIAEDKSVDGSEAENQGGLQPSSSTSYRMSVSHLYLSYKIQRLKSVKDFAQSPLPAEKDHLPPPPYHQPTPPSTSDSGPEGIGLGLRNARCLPCIKENCVRFEEIRSEKMVLPYVVEHSMLPLKAGGSITETYPYFSEQTIAVR